MSREDRDKRRLRIDVATRTVTVGSVSSKLSPLEMAVLLELCGGQVMDRARLARATGLGDRSPRRCDSLMGGIRRAVGEGTIRTVRGRGWALTIPADIVRPA